MSGSGRLKHYVFIGLAFFLTPVLVHGDVMELRGGRQIEGQVIGQTTGFVLFKSGNKVLRIRKKRIRRLRFGATLSEKKLRRALRRRKARARRARRTAELKKIEAEEKKQLGAVEKRRRLVAGLDADLKRLDEQERKIREAEKVLAERKARLARERRRLEERRRAALGPSAGRPVPLKHPAGNQRLERLWRSALIPGWGQYYDGRPLRGGAMLAGFAAAGLWMLKQNASFNRAAETYAETTSTLYGYTAFRTEFAPVLVNAVLARGLYNEQRAAAERTALASTLFIGAYLYNIIDAWFFGAPPPARVSRGRALPAGPRFAFGLEGRGIRLGYAFSF